jgi:hypothetical protein
MRLLLILVCVFGIEGGKDKGWSAPKPAMTIQVWLDQSVEKVKGITWPTEGKKLAESCIIRTDADIVLHFSSGRKFSTFSKATFLDQKNGVVSRATITPLSEAVSFVEALAKVEAFTEEFGVKHDKRISSKIRAAVKVKRRSSTAMAQTLLCCCHPVSEKERWHFFFEGVEAWKVVCA